MYSSSPNSLKIKFRKYTIAEKCDFQSEHPSISSACLPTAEGEASVAAEVSIALRNRMQRSSCCFSAGCSAAPHGSQLCFRNCEHSPSLAGPTAYPCELFGRVWGCGNLACRGGQQSGFSRISQMCLNCWNKDLFTTWKTALAENQQIRPFSLRTYPGTVPVRFNLFLLVGSAFRLA